MGTFHPKFVDSVWGDPGLRDAVLQEFANNRVHSDDPVWRESNAAFEWADVWPVVDREGYLTGDVGMPGVDGMLLSDDGMVILPECEAREGGWKIDELNCEATPPDKGYPYFKSEPALPTATRANRPVVYVENTLARGMLDVCRCALADLEGMRELVEEDHPCFETIEELKAVIGKAEGGE